MKTMIVLAMHGAPPLDFPPADLEEFMSLESRMRHLREAGRAVIGRRHAELENKIRNWPRTPLNDPFHAGSQTLAVELRRASGRRVILGFNEFCAPSLDQALDLAAGQGAEKILVVTPMMTRGGGHAESEIPAAVESARARHPKEKYIYAWPFRASDVAAFLVSQLNKFADAPARTGRI
ncbi:MAG TPA: CbiX/SirB N-terminal domain-containing protein [Candidatus Aminicenantes bacterium]|nr:CbiX/SirB N-terminal domain-containing protein [Candidatus Aminicenantes bacterium]